MFYNGIPLVESKSLINGFSKTPKRRNKNKRIQKKWIKKYGYVPIPDPKIYFFDGKFIGHPLTISKINRKFKKLTF